MTRRPDLPTGTVTFLFTDIEGSTRLMERLGERRYVEVLSQHRATLREAFTARGGVEVDNQGDAFFYAFPEPTAAVAAAAEAQGAIAAGPVSVRMGLHTGEPRLTQEGYAGREIHRAARIAAAAHGGQVVLSRETRGLLDDRFELLDLGEHRVKDFDAPVWLYQLGSERFPPLKTISNTNLPRPASSFVGREREVAEIGALLRDGARLVTLTGPGGTGKTRLAIEAAIEVVPAFRNGVFWVPLAALRDPALVPETIGQTIGAKDGLAEHVGEREMLLLLDNLEQIVESAPELASLVEACPNLRLLVTSRERLRVRGESEYAVPPLADQEAVTLFCERADLEPDKTIAELCHRLDDLPLAVELAAARTSVLSPAQILERLSGRLDLLKSGRDADPRQATLRATIEWSYELLSPDEQRLFARLSVFHGGWTLDAVEAVCDADLNVLSSLVDKSLIRRRDDARFAMLETIREYAVERLDASGEADEIARRHGEFFLAMAEAIFPHLRGSPGEWLDRLDAEHDNMRAALDRFDALDESQSALRLTGSLWKFWSMRGHIAEGSRRLESALRPDQRPTAPRGLALSGATALALDRSEPAIARARAEEALAVYRAAGDPAGVANAVFLLGNVAAREGRFELAQRLFEESLDTFRHLGDDHYTLLSTRLLAWAHYELGDREGATRLHREVVQGARAAGNERMEATSLGALGEYAIRDGRFRDAIPMLQQALAINLRVGEISELSVNLSRLAAALTQATQPDIAAQLLARSESLREEVGLAPFPWVADLNETTLSALRSDLSEVVFAQEWERGRTLSLDEAVALVRASAD